MATTNRTRHAKLAERSNRRKAKLKAKRRRQRTRAQG
jgi:hypothetical protein